MWGTDKKAGTSHLHLWMKKAWLWHQHWGQLYPFLCSVDVHHLQPWEKCCSRKVCVRGCMWVRVRACVSVCNDLHSSSINSSAINGLDLWPTSHCHFPYFHAIWLGFLEDTSGERGLVSPLMLFPIHITGEG